MTDAYIGAMNFLATLLQVDAPKGTAWAPQSVGAWIALCLSVLSVATIFIGYGRWIEKLNGMGGRVTVLERDSAAAKAERALAAADLREMLTQNGVLIKELGKHERDTEACREDTEKLGISLGSAIDGLSREVHGMNDNLSNRLTKVETILEERHPS